MTKNSYLCNFIRSHANWEEVLSGYPYFISIKKEGNLAIFNYNLLASEIVGDEENSVRYTCDFHLPEVQEARGIIINYETYEVVCWPFRKFGNYGESYVDDIDWNSARVQEKVDGSIHKLWFNKEENRWQISSNKMIDADTAFVTPGKTWGELFRIASKNQGLVFDSLNRDYTYIFELVSPLTRVVIQYNEIAIYHLGTRNNITGEEIEMDIGIKKPKSYSLSSLEDCIKAAEALNTNQDGLNVENEGFVVVDKNWHRIKVKSPAYVMVHHALNNGVLSKKRIIELILENEVEEYLTYYPAYADVFKLYTEKLEKFQNELHGKYVYYSKLWDEMEHDHKKFAMKINKDKRCSWGFDISRYSKTEQQIFDDMTTLKLINELDAIKD